MPPSPSTGPLRAEQLQAVVVAQRFHEAYESLAPDFGYKTREASAVPWADVPADNRALMVATVGRVLASLETDQLLQLAAERMGDEEREALVERIALANFQYEFKGTPEEHTKGPDGWCTEDWMDAIRDSIRFFLAALLPGGSANG